jgi:hypothetical protein
VIVVGRHRVAFGDLHRHMRAARARGWHLGKYLDYLDGKRDDLRHLQKLIGERGRNLVLFFDNATVGHR